MSAEVKTIGGILLIIGFVFYMIAAPALVNASSSVANNPNNSEFLRQSYLAFGNLLGIFPYVFWLVGVGMIWKG